ncbi:hypothetical protein AMELA_G00263540 [Ameiurus melas]|uniref:Small integral membrane protein 15 n=1 Tax=Ameiurus melas TaxID=219545 RepID=A0A7J5ZPU4_AMEME|nr:hypothetical protein AMELA_G00263540 [Ameiurus melas]
MIDVKAWAEYVVEWAAKDPYGFLTTVILALTPLFIASALLSWKLAKMIENPEQNLQGLWVKQVFEMALSLATRVLIN